MLTEHWQIFGDSPGIILNFVGHDLADWIEAEAKDAIEGLTRMAASTGAVVITKGVNKGLTKLFGEAFQAKV